VSAKVIKGINNRGDLTKTEKRLDTNDSFTGEFLRDPTTDSGMPAGRQRIKEIPVKNHATDNKLAWSLQRRQPARAC
jgi:hypothetical protein